MYMGYSCMAISHTMCCKSHWSKRTPLYHSWFLCHWAACSLHKEKEKCVCVCVCVSVCVCVCVCVCVVCVYIAVRSGTWMHMHLGRHIPCSLAFGHRSGFTQAPSHRSTAFPKGHEHPLRQSLQTTGKGSLQKETQGAQAPLDASK